MFLKKIPLLLLFISLSPCCRAQGDDFCDAVAAIMQDAPNAFRNIRGKETGSNMGATLWESGIKIPGAIGSRFVSSMGLFYEGAVYQSADTAGLWQQYEMYKSMLSKCLPPQGYWLSASVNFYPGMQQYKKIAYLPILKPDGETRNLPSHAAMEVEYDKARKLYTIIIFIYQH